MEAVDVGAASVTDAITDRVMAAGAGAGSVTLVVAALVTAAGANAGYVSPAVTTWVMGVDGVRGSFAGRRYHWLDGACLLPSLTGW